MTKEFLQMAQEIENSGINPEHARGARLLQGYVSDLMKRGLLPENFPFSDVLLIKNMGLEQFINPPHHSRFTFDATTGIIKNLHSDCAQLTPTERRIFEILFQNIGTTVSTDKINKENGWEPSNGSARVKTVIRRIRRKCDSLGLREHDFSKGYIFSVREFGYVMLEPDNPEHRKFARFKLRQLS